MPIRPSCLPVKIKEADFYTLSGRAFLKRGGIEKFSATRRDNGTKSAETKGLNFLAASQTEVGESTCLHRSSLSRGAGESTSTEATKNPRRVITFTGTRSTFTTSLASLRPPLSTPVAAGIPPPPLRQEGRFVSLFVLLETAPQVARRGSSRAAFYSPKWFARPTGTNEPRWPARPSRFAILIFSLLTFNKYTRGEKIDGTNAE